MTGLKFKTEPTDIFDNLDALRVDVPPGGRRARSTATFARIPHDRAYEADPEPILPQ